MSYHPLTVTAAVQPSASPLTPPTSVSSTHAAADSLPASCSRTTCRAPRCVSHTPREDVGQHSERQHRNQHAEEHADGAILRAQRRKGRRWGAASSSSSRVGGAATHGGEEVPPHEDQVEHGGRGRRAAPTLRDTREG
jgi:hypothetical protein